MIVSNQRVIVMGGSRGIGRSIALAFASAGAAVSICARGHEALEATRSEIAALGGIAHGASIDLNDAAAIARYVPEAADRLGGLTVLVNNASAFAMSDDEAGWAASLSVDMMAVVRGSQAATPLMGAGSSIINIASIAGCGASGLIPYGAAKAAVIHYTASLAKRLAPDRIRVNCVTPGSIEFPDGIWDRRRREDPAGYQQILDRIPFGRLGRPEEIASVVLFLASEAGGWITGQSIVVDGGQLL